MQELPHLDRKHVVFGKLVKGFGAFEMMEKAGTTGGSPKQK